MSHPALVRTRLAPLRRLTPAECEVLEYAGPLLLARRERRFVVGPWRPGHEVLVVTPRSPDGHQRVVMVCTPAQLRERGIEPGT